MKGLLGFMPESGFKIAVQNHCEKLRRRTCDLTSTRAKKEKEKTETETNWKHLKEQLRVKEDTLRNSKDQMDQVLGADDYQQKLDSLRSEIDGLQDVKGALSSSEFMYKR